MHSRWSTARTSFLRDRGLQWVIALVLGGLGLAYFLTGQPPARANFAEAERLLELTVPEGSTRAAWELEHAPFKVVARWVVETDLSWDEYKILMRRRITGYRVARDDIGELVLIRHLETDMFTVEFMRTDSQREPLQIQVVVQGTPL